MTGSVEKGGGHETGRKPASAAPDPAHIVQTTRD